MYRIETTTIICPSCAQSCTARWREELGYADGGPSMGRSASGRRTLLGLTSGFYSLDRDGRREPEIVCMRCHNAQAVARPAKHTPRVLI